MRLDLYIAESRKVTRNRAKFFIEQSLVKVNGIITQKSSQNISDSDTVEVLDDNRTDFVARSAVKLDRYLVDYAADSGKKEGVSITGAICLDVGSSTGGFVQVLLTAGAKEVVALDVGTDQLHASIRSNPRVISLENMDFREYDREEKEFDIITTDVSFISLHHLLPAFVRAASAHTKLILLFKPQFEVGKENLTKAHLPKSEEVITEAMARFREALEVHGFAELDCRESELPGEIGNREWVFLLKRK